MTAPDHDRPLDGDSSRASARREVLRPIGETAANEPKRAAAAASSPRVGVAVMTPPATSPPPLGAETAVARTTSGDDLRGVPGVVCMSEQQFAAQQAADLAEAPTLPLVVLLVFAALFIGGQAVVGWMQVGPAAAIGAGLSATIGLAVSVIIGVPVALLVAKMFADDYGDFGIVCLRVSAICALNGCAGLLLTAVIGPLMGLIFGFPVLMLISAWLLGIEMGKAAIYALLCSVAKFVLGMLIMSSLAVTFLR